MISQIDINVNFCRKYSYIPKTSALSTDVFNIYKAKGEPFIGERKPMKFLSTQYIKNAASTHIQKDIFLGSSFTVFPARENSISI